MGENPILGDGARKGGSGLIPHKGTLDMFSKFVTSSIFLRHIILPLHCNLACISHFIFCIYSLLSLFLLSSGTKMRDCKEWSFVPSSLDFGV